MSIRRALIVICAFILCLTPLTRAQEDNGPIMEAGPLAVPFSSRDLGTFCKTVGFDNDQTATARTLQQGYRAAYTTATTKTRHKTDDMVKEMQEGKTDWQKFSQDRGRLTMQYVEDLRKLELGLIDDLKALCTPAQLAKFPAAERARRRDTGFLVAFGAGERVDLISMLNALKIDRHATPALDELATQWETNVDRLLVEKDKAIRDGMKEMMGRDGGPESMERVKKFLTDLTAISNRVGEANRRAATEAQGLIPEAQRAAFADELKVRSFPRIYGPSYITKSIKSAQDMKDISADQKTKLKDLAEAYQREAGPINSRWATAAEEKQRQFISRFMEMMDNDKEDEADAFYIARKERRALDDRYQAKIVEVLTSEQKDQLPKAPERRNHGVPEFFPDFEADFKGQWDQWQTEGGDHP